MGPKKTKPPKTQGEFELILWGIKWFKSWPQAARTGWTAKRLNLSLLSLLAINGSYLPVAVAIEMNQKTLSQQLEERYQPISKFPNQEQTLNAYSAVGSLSNQAVQKPYFKEIYLAPEYNSHWDLATLPVQARIGKSYGTQTVVEPYISYRDTIDNRSKDNQYGSEIYNDTVAVLAAGIRIKPKKDLPISLFIEHGTAYNRIGENKGRWQSDTRGGILYYQEWNTWLAPLPNQTNQRFIADLYAEGIYYSRYSNNWISYFRARPGVRLYEDSTQSLDTYIHLGHHTDSRNVMDNRYQEIGVGFAYRVFTPLRLTFRAVSMQINTKGLQDNYSTTKVLLEHDSRF